MAEGDVRLDIGIDLDAALAAIDRLEKKLLGLPDVKADVRLNSDKADAQLTKLKQELQSKAGQLTVKAKAEYGELDGLKAAADGAQNAIKEAANVAEQNPIRAKIDLSDVVDFDEALTLASNAFRSVANEVKKNIIVPGVDQEQLHELNRELARKQRHWLQTQRLIKQNPIKGSVTLTESHTINSKPASTGSASGNRQTSSARLSAVVPEARASDKKAIASIVKGILPPAQQRFSIEAVSRPLLKQIKLFTESLQRQNGVLLDFVDSSALDKFTKQINAQQGSPAGRTRRPVDWEQRSNERQKRLRQQNNYELFDKSRYSESEIEQAFARMRDSGRKIDELLSQGKSLRQAHIEVAPHLASTSQFKFTPFSKIKQKSEALTPREIESERIVNGYVQRRNERLSGAKSSTPPQINSSPRLVVPEVLPPTEGRPRRRRDAPISTGLASDLDLLGQALASQVRTTSDFIKAQSKRIDDRQKRLTSEITDLGSEITGGKELAKAINFIPEALRASVVDATKGNALDKALKAVPTAIAASLEGALKLIPDEFSKRIERLLDSGFDVVKTKDLHTAPHELQYKIATNKRGEAGSLKGVEEWNKDLAGVLSVWKNPKDGKTYVVNGHNRLGLAEDKGVEDLPVKYIKADSFKEARRIGAIENIASGAGTEIDAAKFFRDSGIDSLDSVKKIGLPLTSGLADFGLKLAKLPAEIFDAVVRGDLSSKKGAVIGGNGLDEVKMREIFKWMQGKTVSETNLSNMVKLAAFSDQESVADDSRQTDIFGKGGLKIDDNLLQLGKVTTEFENSLKKDKRLFSVISDKRNASSLEAKGGNSINVEKSAEVAQDAARILQTFDILKSSDPKILELIKASAKLIKEGASMSDAITANLPAVSAAVEDYLANTFKKKPKNNEIESQDVLTGQDQLAFAKQQALAAADAGDVSGAKAWKEEQRKLERLQISKELDAASKTQSSLFGIGEHDTSMPLLNQPKDAGKDFSIAANDVVTVIAEVVDSVVSGTADLQSELGTVIEAPKKVSQVLRENLDELRRVDAQQFAAQAEMLFENSWALKDPKFKGMSKEDARTQYIQEWSDKLNSAPKALPQASGEAVPYDPNFKISDVLKKTLDDMKESDKRVGQLGKEIADLTRGTIEFLSNENSADNQVSGSTKATTTVLAEDKPLHRIALGKRELEGLQNSLELDNEEASSTKALIAAKIELSRSMKLTDKQLAILAYELDNVPLLDDIRSLSASEINKEHPGQYLTNAQAGFKKIREQAFGAGLIRRDDIGRVQIADSAKRKAITVEAETGGKAQPAISAFEKFKSLISEFKEISDNARPYKPSSRMFGGARSEWTEDQNKQFTEAQSKFRSWDKENKLVTGIDYKNKYDANFPGSFSGLALEGMAGILENKKGGLQAKTTNDFSEALTEQTGRNVPNSRKEIAGELRGLSGEAADSFISGILDNISEETEAGSRMGHALIQGIKSALQMHSPSRILLEMGRLAAWSLAEGFRQASQQLEGSFGNSVQKYIDAGFDAAKRGTTRDNRDYSWLTEAVTTPTINPAHYAKRLNQIGPDNLAVDSPMFEEARKRQEFNQYMPSFYEDRMQRQTPGTLEKMIDEAWVKSTDKFSSTRFSSSDMTPHRGAARVQDPFANPGILMGSSGRMRGKLPRANAALPASLFDTQNTFQDSVVDPWSLPDRFKMSADQQIQAVANKKSTPLLPPRFGTSSPDNKIPDPWEIHQAEAAVSDLLETILAAAARMNTASQKLLPPANRSTVHPGAPGNPPPPPPRNPNWNTTSQPGASGGFGTPPPPPPRNPNWNTTPQPGGLTAPPGSGASSPPPPNNPNWTNPGNRGGGSSSYPPSGNPPGSGGSGSHGGGPIPPAGAGMPPNGPPGGGLGGPTPPGGSNPGQPLGMDPNHSYNDWLDTILPGRGQGGTGSRGGFNALIDALRQAEREFQEFTARANSAGEAARRFEASTDPGENGPPRTYHQNQYLAELQNREDMLRREADARQEATRIGRMRVRNYGFDGNIRAVDNAYQSQGGADNAGQDYEAPGAFTRNGSVQQTLDSIDAIRSAGNPLRELFSHVDTTPIQDINTALQEVRQALQMIRELSDNGLIDSTDLIRAEQGARSLTTALNMQAAETQGFARDFENLGIQSEASINSVRRARDESNLAIQSSGLSDREKARANNARDIQELTYVQEQIRGAQGASGFGGFRGREIGDANLNEALQRTQLRNYRHNLEETRNNMRLAPDPQSTTGGFLNENTRTQAMAAIDQQIENADRSFRVLEGSASDGEKAFETMRNAFGIFSDDLSNLIPQLVAFDFAFNILYSTLLPLPQVVLQTTAEFDRLSTSIGSYLQAQRGISDSSSIISELKKQSLDLGTQFEQTAQSYLSFAGALEGTPLEGKELDITRTLGTAGRNLGLSGEQIGRVSTALTQIVGKGTVQMEELRQQLAEQMPGALQVTARAFGVTTEELYRMVQAGEIAGDEFVEKFIKQLKAEGADVNVLSGTFSNLQEQLGAALQQLGATAGEPLFVPLTLGLQLLNNTVKAFIPLGGLLSVGALLIGANMLKTTLRITSLKDAFVQLTRAGLAFAAGDKAGAMGLLRGPQQPTPILDQNGVPYTPTQPTGNPPRNKPGFREQLKNAGRSLKTFITDDSATKSQKINNAWKGIGANIERTGPGLKAFAKGMGGLLLSTLKLYAVFELISLVTKQLTGENNPLRGVSNRMEARKRGQSAENAPAWTGGQRFFAALNPSKGLGFMNLKNTTNDVITENKRTLGLLKSPEVKYAKWRMQDAKDAKKQNQIRFKIDSSKNISQTDRQNLLNQEKEIKQAREKNANSLPVSFTDMASLADTNSLTLSANKEESKRGLNIAGVGQKDIEQYLANKISLDQALSKTSPNGATRINLEDLEKQRKELEKYDKLLGDIRKKLGGQDVYTPLSSQAVSAEITGLEEQNKKLDLNDPQQKKAYDVNVAKIKKLNLSLEIASLSTSEKTLRLDQERSKAAEQASSAIQIANQVKLEQLDQEKTKLEAINELESKRRELAEAKLQGRINISRATGMNADALEGERQLIQLQAQNRQAEIRDKSRMIGVDRKRFSYERDSAIAEIKARKAQLMVQRSEESVSNINLKMYAEDTAALAKKSPGRKEFQDRAAYAKQLLKQSNDTLKALSDQITASDALVGNANSLYDTKVKESEIQQQILDVTSQLSAQTKMTEQQQNDLDRYKDKLDSTLAAYKEQINVQEASADSAIKGLQDKLDLSQKYIDMLDKEQAALQENAGIRQQVLDSRIQNKQNQTQGGFFTRIDAINNPEKESLYSLGLERKKNMEEMASLQQQAALATLDIEQQKLKIQEAMLKIEEQKARLALGTQRAELVTQMTLLREKLRVSMVNSPDFRKDATGTFGIINPKDPRKKAYDDLGAQIGAEPDKRVNGFATVETQQDPNLVLVTVTNLKARLDQIDATIGQTASAFGKGGEAIDATRKQILRLQDLNKSNADLQAELSAANIRQWWNEFLDGLGGLGRVLNEFTQGLDQFRSSVASALADGLRGGDAMSAISEAAGNLADKLTSSLIDEFILKPMQENLFAGLAMLWGKEKAVPPDVQTEKNTGEMKTSIDKSLTIEESSLQQLKDLNAKVADLIVRAGVGNSVTVATGAATPGSLPAGSGVIPMKPSDVYQAVNSVASAVSGSAFDTGLKSGPTARNGGSAEYHQDLMFGSSVSMADRVKYMDKLAKSYEALGRTIEFSNNGVAGERYKSSMGQEEKVSLLERAQIAHSSRPGGSGRAAIDYYAPLASETRFGRSVEGQSMLAPAVENGSYKYSSGGAYGNNMRAYKGGQMIYEIGHGDTGVALPSAPPATATRPIIMPSTAAIPIPDSILAPAPKAGSNPSGLGTYWSPSPSPTVASTAPVPVVVTNTPAATTPGPMPPAVPAVETPTPATGASTAVPPGTPAGSGIGSLPASAQTAKAGLDNIGAAANQGADQIKEAGNKAQEVPSKFEKLNSTIGGITSVLGSVAMGIAGIDQMKKGGTYNTLMGLAGIFGSLGSITGFFGKGGFGGMFRASGGPVSAHTPYIVGEKGPELVTFGANGHVFSNSDSADIFSKTRSNVSQQQMSYASKAAPSPAGYAQPIDVRYESQVINKVEYVTAEQHRKGMQEAARRGQMMAYQGMQQSVKVRRRLGM